MKDSEFATFAARYHAHFCRDANQRLRLGIEEHLGELPDPSLGWVEATTRGAFELLNQSDALLNRPDLTREQSIDLELAELALKSEVFRLTCRFNDGGLYEQLPNAGSDVGDGVFLLFVDRHWPASDRLHWITERIERIPGYLDAALARLTVPVSRWVDMDVAKVGGLDSLFSSVTSLAEDARFVDRPRLTAACRTASDALNDYVRKLRALPTTSQFSVGHKSAERIITLRGIQLSPQELQQIATRFLATTAEQIEELRGRLVRKHALPQATNAEELMRFLQNRYRIAAEDGDFSGVLHRYEAELGNILAFIRERDLFPVPEDQALTVLRTPAFMAPSIPAGAMMSPPPFRPGVRRSLVYLTLSEELLDEHTELGIPLMMIHEGIPGHHLQLSSAATHPSTIRRHIEAMDQAEGWTTMLEDYMIDAGYGGDLSDEIRFIGKREIARLGARVAIDLFFMIGDKSYLDVGIDCPLGSEDAFECAGNLLQSVTGFVPQRVQAELNWYSQERGYPLSYLAGNHLVWQLMRDVRIAHPGSTDEADRDFFRAFLAAGNMPVAFLRREFQERGLVNPAPSPQPSRD